MRHAALDQLLARVLQQGTRLGSCVIASGLALALVRGSVLSPGIMGAWIINVGIALLIALPVLRVLLMAIVFFRERDFRLSAIAMLVLVIIALGCISETLGSRRL